VSPWKPDKIYPLWRTVCPPEPLAMYQIMQTAF